jgi:cell shape-determining protein MreC
MKEFEVDPEVFHQIQQLKNENENLKNENENLKRFKDKYKRLKDISTNIIPTTSPLPNK